MHRSTPTHERTSEGGSVRSGGAGVAPEPARLSFDGSTKGAGEGGSPGKAAAGEVEEGEAGQVRGTGGEGERRVVAPDGCYGCGLW